MTNQNVAPDSEPPKTLADIATFDKAHARSYSAGNKRAFTGDMQCATCGGVRRVSGETKFGHPSNHTQLAVAEVACVQCDAEWVLVRYMIPPHGGPEDSRLVVLPMVERGLDTPHTPPSVSYYLDQAERSRNVGANSAAVAMYRSAVEQMLHEQGFKMRMLGPKIAALEVAIANKTAPPWAILIDPEYLTILKDLGNASIHAGDEAVEKSALFDAEMLEIIVVTMMGLLWHVYEEEHEKQAHLGAARAARAKVRK